MGSNKSFWKEACVRKINTISKQVKSLIINVFQNDGGGIPAKMRQKKDSMSGGRVLELKWGLSGILQTASTFR